MSENRDRYKPPYGAMTILLSYYILTVTIGITLPGTLLSDLLVTPLFFMIPIGLGLLVLNGYGPCSSNPVLTRAQQIVFAFFIGSVFFTFIFMVREKHGFWGVPSKSIFWVVFLVSMVGFYRTINLNGRRRVINSEYLIFISAFFFVLISYFIKFYFFSSYPLTDLFQECHLMKGATEFARFDILNRLTADSYIPIIQVGDGILNHVFGYNLLRAKWIFPLFASLINILSIYAVISVLLDDRSTRWIAWMISVILLGDLYLTNGVMARNATLILLSLLIFFSKIETSSKKTVLLILIITGTLFLGRKLIESEDYYLGFLSIIILTTIYLSNRLSKNNAIIFLSTLLVLILVPVHRSVILFFPSAVGVFALLFFIKKFPLLKRNSNKRIAFVYFVPVPLLASGIFGTAVVLKALHDHTVLGDSTFKGLSNFITKLLLKQTIDSGGEILLGAGSKLAALEFGRMLPPIMTILLAGGGSIYWYLQFRSKEKIQRKNSNKTAFVDHNNDELLMQMIWLWLTISILLFVILTGIPYTYRISFIAVLFSAVVIAQLIRFFHVRLDKKNLIAKGIKGFSLFILFYVFWADLFLYKFVFYADATKNYYLVWFKPVALFFYFIILFLILIILSIHRYVKIIAVLSIVCLCFSVYIDKQSIKVKFMDFSYGKKNPANTAAITHYSIYDVNMAYRLRTLPQKSILISDPYTLSILRAITGLNAPINYSNIATINLKTRVLLRNMINDTVMCQQKSNERKTFCNDLKEMLELGSGELNYAYLHTKAHETSQIMVNVKPASSQYLSVSGSQAWINNEFFGQNKNWKLVVIVGKKTLEWAKNDPINRTSYYPMIEKLSLDLIKCLEKKYNILFNVDDRIVAFEINC